MEDNENLGDKESNTPVEHSLGKTEKERQVLETVGIVPALGEVGVLEGKSIQVASGRRNIDEPLHRRSLERFPGVESTGRHQTWC